MRPWHHAGVTSLAGDHDNGHRGNPVAERFDRKRMQPLEKPIKMGYWFTMVTIHRSAGLRFVIYTNDHDPAHVHAIAGDGEAKINLSGASGAPELVWVVGLKRSVVRRALTIVEQHRDEFLSRWEGIHG